MEKSSYLVNCASCGTANRIPANKEGVAGHCGHCKTILPPLYYQPHPLTEKAFDQFAKNFPGLILAEFWAPW
jgi:thioredoxin 2